MGNLSDIQNLTVAELKARREELLTQVRQANPATLGPRYLQALFDAKRRDQRMAEQGAQILELERQLANANAQVHELADALKQSLSLKGIPVAAPPDPAPAAERQRPGIMARIWSALKGT